VEFFCVPKETSEKILRLLLQEAGITINGPERRDIQVHDRRFYRRVLSDVDLGLDLYRAMLDSRMNDPCGYS